MKKDIHPEYFQDAKMNCSCGSVFQTGSTVKELSIETCSQCHPFFTGKQKIVDSTGRVDRFKKISEKASEAQKKRTHVQSKEAKQAQKIKKQEEKLAA